MEATGGLEEQFGLCSSIQAWYSQIVHCSVKYREVHALLRPRWWDNAQCLRSTIDHPCVLIVFTWSLEYVYQLVYCTYSSHSSH